MDNDMLLNQKCTRVFSVKTSEDLDRLLILHGSERIRVECEQPLFQRGYSVSERELREQFDREFPNVTYDNVVESLKNRMDFWISKYPVVRTTSPKNRIIEIRNSNIKHICGRRLESLLAIIKSCGFEQDFKTNYNVEPEKYIRNAIYELLNNAYTEMFETSFKIQRPKDIGQWHNKLVFWRKVYEPYIYMDGFNDVTYHIVSSLCNDKMVSIILDLQERKSTNQKYIANYGHPFYFQMNSFPIIDFATS